MSSLPLNTNINTKDKSDKQFYKMRNNVSSVNATATTAQNSIKTNIGLLSNMDMIKPIQKNKSKNKIENIKAKNCSTPNLFDKVHNHVNLNKEKPNKIYNNSTYLSKTNKKQIATSTNSTNAIPTTNTTTSTTTTTTLILLVMYLYFFLMEFLVN